MSQRRVAAFDFDGTITRHDSLIPFLRQHHRWRTTAAFLASAPHIAVGAGNWRDRAKVQVIGRILAGTSVADLEAQGASYAATLPLSYRPDVIDRIGWHRGQDHELVLVTASLGVYARPAGLALGFDHVIAVELEHRDGHYTGELAAPNVRGPQKAHRLRRHIGSDTFELWAYGNSRGDDELLAMADHPTRISRRATLSSQS